VPKTKRNTRAGAARNARTTRTGRRGTEVALAGLAHDIRTPLTGIVALADLLQASDLPEREHRWTVALKSAAGHLARLTTLVVDATKAGTTGLTLREDAFSPRDMAKAIGDALAARTEAKGLSARVSIARDLPDRVSGDAVRLRSALENLIDNAVKFTERGAIRFSIVSDRIGAGHHRLTFKVADDGIGIVASDLEKLFRPFAQASEDIARRYGGAGLGLVSVKRIAAAMGGDLTVTSEPGKGSTFVLTVLVRAVGRREGKPSQSQAPSSSGLHVLCVEDNPYGRVVLDAILSELGHRVAFAGSGEAAVAAVKRGGHDAVLMDVTLSGMDGIEATRRIRKLKPPASRIPIIGVSGRTETGDAAAARAAGMDGYLRKPPSPAALNEMLARIAAGKSRQKRR
jgi:CheY-like chemotaxis protein/nitrogen-specific signal transduction histidine kinase